MMLPKPTLLKATILASLLAAGVAAAQEDPWYGGAGSALLDPGNSLGLRGSLPGEFAMGGASPDMRSAYRHFGGYRFTDSLAIEGAQTTYGQGGNGCAGDAMSNDASHACAGSAWSVSGVATLPFQSGLSVYGRLGLHYWQKGSQEDIMRAREAIDVGSVLGVGVSYELSRAVTFRAESEHFSDLSGAGGNTPGSALGLDASVHSIGLSIKF